MATLLSLLAVPAAAGAAYGGVKVGLNGVKAVPRSDRAHC